MIDTGTFYVLTYGKRYFRIPKYGIVTRQLEFAHQFSTAYDAGVWRKKLREEGKKQKSKHAVDTLRISVSRVA